MGSGAAARTDYSQLVSTGPVELAGPIVIVVGKPSEKAPCPVLAPGQKYTFVSTTGTLSGTFANAPEGGLEILIDFAKECNHPSQTIQITYSRNGSTETVTGTVEAQAKKRQEEEAKEKEVQEAKEKETQEREAKEKEEAKEEEIRKLVAEHAQKVGEEAAATEASATEKREAEAAVAIAKKHQEEEVTAAATKRHQEENEEAAATGSVSLDGTTITVQSSGEAQVKLTCAGTGACAGRLTLTYKSTPKKGKQAKTEIIGTASLSVPAGKTVTIELKLNTPGRALLGADHGRLSASLTLLKSSPAPSQTHTESVHLVQQKAHGKAKK